MTRGFNDLTLTLNETKSDILQGQALIRGIKKKVKKEKKTEEKKTRSQKGKREKEKRQIYRKENKDKNKRIVSVCVQLFRHTDTEMDTELDNKISDHDNDN